MVELPEHVYLVTVDGEWPVSAIADDHPSIAATIELAVDRRAHSQNVSNRAQVHVWKARLVDCREVDLIPATTTEPQIRERKRPEEEQATVGSDG